MNIDFMNGQSRLYCGLYETELNSHLRRLCRPGYRAYDIGGQFGYDALIIAKLTHAEVVSVECDPNLIREMRLNIAANPGVGNLIVVREGFVEAETDDSLNHLTLDQLAEETFVPDFVKMDIEGGEAAALRGFRSVLQTRRPSLIVEVHSRELEDVCLGLLRESGYMPELVSQRRWLGDYRPIEHNRWIVAQGQ